MSEVDEQSFQQRLGRIESLLQHVERFSDPQAQDTTREIVQLLMDLHGRGLAQMLQIVSGHQQGAQIIDEMTTNDLVSHLLLLYDLHPQDSEARARQALEEVRPYLQSHAGDVELIGVSPDGVAQLQVHGTCQECPAFHRTLSLVIESAILERAPEITSIVTDGRNAAPPPATKLTLPLLGDPANDSRRGGWVALEENLNLEAGEVVLRTVSGLALIFCRIEATLYSFERQCPNCDSSLEEARLHHHLLTCTSCEQAFDVQKAGRGLSQAEHWLRPVPLLETENQIRLALPMLSG